LLFFSVLFVFSLSMLNQGCSSTPTTPATATPTPTVAPTVAPTISIKRIFATSGSFTGNLGGLAGADTVCASYATSAGLTGTWVAYLSSSTTNAYDRITSNGPFYLVDKTTRIFHNKAGFLTTPINYISQNESGSDASGYNIWTGTLSTGLKSTNTSNNWTEGSCSYYGTYGYLGSLSSWCYYSYTCSSSSYHLLCIEQ
jgi:hypothetical protein